MPSKPIRKPKKQKEEEQTELDLDAITDSLSNKPYHQNTNPDEPEPTHRTTVEIPESLMIPINIAIFKNKMRKKDPKTLKGMVLECIKYYAEHHPDLK